ncbi:MAG: hypothetical protein QM758_13820 [Armatimonas sp.]
MATAYVLTGAERTVELECEVIAPFTRSDNGSTQTEFVSSGYAKCGQKLSGVVEAPLLRVQSSGQTSAVSTFLGGNAGVTATGTIPSPPYSIGGAARAWAKLSLVLEQYQRTDSGYVGERVKPGAYHTLEYELSAWDGSTSNNTVTLTQGSTVRLIEFLDQCQQANSIISSSTNTSNTVVATAQGPWDTDFQPYNQTVTQSSGSQSSTVTADIFDNGTAQVEIAGNYQGNGLATGHPILKYTATIEPHFWNIPYDGSYKVLSAGASTPNGAFPSNSSVSGSGAHSYLHGPFSGSDSYSDDSHGGYSHIQIGLSQSFIGNRAGSFTLSMVSATSTNPLLPIVHEDHPDGDLVAIRTDQSAGLSISIDGGLVIEDGSTLTPTGGEWTKLTTTSGSLTHVSGGGVRMQAGAPYTMFLRGWATYTGPPLYIKLSGDPINCSAYRFADITYDAATVTHVTLYLAYDAGHPGGASGIEIADPGSAGHGTRKWELVLPAGSGIYRLDLCNPDIWDVMSARKDPPYIIYEGSGDPPFSSPENYEVTDMDQLRGGLVGVDNEGNFSATSQFARWQFLVWDGGDVTIKLIELLPPDNIHLDMGHVYMRLWGNGKLLAERSLAAFNSGSYPSGHNVEALRQYLDQIPGFSATTSLSTGGTEPPDWSDRTDWEDWNGRSAYLFYWGNLTNTNLGLKGSTVSAQIPLIGGHVLPGNQAISTPGYGPENSLYVRARFGAAFCGLCLRESYEIGTGTVEVVDVGTELVDEVGAWGFSDSPPLPCRVDSPWRTVRWVDAELEQLPMRPGNREVADPALLSMRGFRRFTGFKAAPIDDPCGLFIDTDGLFPFEPQFTDPMVTPED